MVTGKLKLITGLLMLSLLSMPVACVQPTQVEPTPDALTPTPTPSPESIPTSTGWTTFTADDGLASNVVTSIIQDNQGVIWVGGMEGLTRYDDNHFEFYPGSLRSIPIACSARDSQGNLWFGTASDAAYKYTGEEWQNIIPAISDLRPNVTVQDILVDIQGDIWFAVTGNQGKRTAPIDHGVTRYNGSDFWINFLGRTHVTTIFQDNQGNLWFGSNVGVTRYDGADWRTFTEEDGLADNYVVAITEDSEGNMWFGTWNDGVSRYDVKEWRTFHPEDGLETSAVHCMLTDSRGNLWFGSYCIDGYYGISCFDGTQWQHFDPWPNTNKYNVISIFEDNKGNIWFATSIGLVRYDPGLPDSTLGTEIKVEPEPGSYLRNAFDESSRVILKDVVVNNSVCDKQYTRPPLPIVNVGDPCLVVTGHIQNMHQENSEIAMDAEGYDISGEQVAWTLDAAHIVGQIGLHLEYEETGEFTLHMNASENVSTIRIYAHNYSMTPP